MTTGALAAPLAPPRPPGVAERRDAACCRAAHPIAWPLARLARRLGPVVRVPGFGLVVSDAALAHAVLVRDADFTKNGPGSLAAIMTRHLGPAALGNMDGAEHARLRGLVADLFAPAAAPALLAACDAPLAALRAALAAGEAVDLVRWMRALSGRVTFTLLGATREADDEAACLALLALGERIAAAFSFRAPRGARARQVAADCAALAALARRGWDARDDEPRAGAASDGGAPSLVRRLKDAGLAFDEARGVLSLVFLAGTLTTSVALPRLVALLADAGALDALRHDAEGRAHAIAEGLRFTTPVPATARIAARDATLGAHRVRRGTRVAVLTCNTARDPRLFADPDRFDPRRVPEPRARHLWYGAGPHFCLGFHVAQRQLRLVLDALCETPRPLRVVDRSVARRVLMPGYASLVVRADGPAT